MIEQPAPVSALLSTPRLDRALRYWEGKRGARLMPSRRDLDPLDIIDLLPFVVLIDVLDDPRDYRYRLVGTEVTAISHRDRTGSRYSEVEGKGPESVLWTSNETVVATRAPLSWVPPYIGPETRIRNCGNILLPLSADGETVNMIFKVVDFQRF